MKRPALIALVLIPLLTAGCGASKDSSIAGSDDSVDVGYVKSSKNKLSGSVGHVKNKDNRVYDSIFDYFRDKVPGVRVEGSDPASTKVYIRGINSIEAPSDPLFIVDGVTVDDISSINPYEVKSVDVLKDSEAAIYGVRGTNGVIIILLKKSEE